MTSASFGLYGVCFANYAEKSIVWIFHVLDARLTLRFLRLRLLRIRERVMKLPGGMDIQKMMKQAQKMQEDMARTMAEIRVDATAGGGIVTVTMTGNKELVSIKIDPDAVKEGDVEMLQDLIVAA